MDVNVDVLVIGGGVFGCAIAERLSRAAVSVCLVEKCGDLAEGASKGNAGVTASVFTAPDTLDARMIAATSPRWEDVCDRLDVPFRRIGALVSAVSDDELPHLQVVYDESVSCGARAHLVTGAKAREMEPLLSSECRAAVHLPDEGLIDPMRLTCALAELAAINGCQVLLNSPIIDFETDGERLTAALTPERRISARYYVNAAGLHADLITTLAGGRTFRMWPRKGQWWVLDRSFGARMKRIVNAVPIPNGPSKGIHVIPTSRGTVLLGPTADDEEDKDDRAKDAATLSRVLERAQRLVPSVSLAHVIKSFSGLRPASDRALFVEKDDKRKNLIHAVSRSVGVSASLAVADYIAEMLGSEMDMAEVSGKERRLPRVFHPRYEEAPRQDVVLSAADKTIICVCEQVTAGEISAALTRQVPARSIDGIWKRTGATGGRCQGALCLTGTAFLISAHRGCAPADVQVKDRACLGIGSSRNG